MKQFFAVMTVLLAIVVLWYLAVAPMNIRVSLDQAERAGESVTPEASRDRQQVSVWVLMTQNSAHIVRGYELDRPRLPTPVQVGQELWKTTGEMAMRGRAMSKRSLIYHGWITLQSTLWGFVLGTAVGILGAVAIVYSRVVDMSLMPWAIISQTVPIVALGPDDHCPEFTIGDRGARGAKGHYLGLFVLLPGSGRDGQRAAVACRFATGFA